MQQGTPPTERAGLVARLLVGLTQQGLQHPWLTLALVLVSVAATVAYTLRDLQFKTDRSDLIDPKADFHQRWLAYAENFGDKGDLIVVVEAEDPNVLKATLDRLGSRLQSEPQFFQNVLYKVDASGLKAKGLQYLSPQQLEEHLGQVEMMAPVVRGQWELLRVDETFGFLTNQLEYRLRNAELPQPGRSTKLDPLFAQSEQLVSSMDAYLENPAGFQAPWPDMSAREAELGQANQVVSYLLNDDGTMGFIRLVAAGDARAALDGRSPAIDRLRQIVAETGKQHPAVRLGVTGIPVLETDEMRKSQSDMLLASVISAVGVALIMLVGFRGFRHPLLAMLTLGVGMAWAFGFSTLAIGHLNILSVSFAAMLLGLGGDFCIHYLSRYLALRNQQQGLEPALLESSRSVGVGLLTAMVTTALAFFCATLTTFLGVAELGIIAGGGILLCGLACFLVLPALVTLSDRKLDSRALPAQFQGLLLRAAIQRYPLLVLFGSLLVVLTLSACTFKYERGQGLRPRVVYDYNLLNMQADGLESVDVQNRIFEKNKNSLLFAVSVADSPEQARLLKQKFEALPSVHHVEELASRLPEYPITETGLYVQALRAQLAPLPEVPARVEIDQPPAVGQAMEAMYLLLKDRPEPAAQRITARLDQFLDRFAALDARTQQRFLNDFQAELISSLHRQLSLLKSVSDPEPIQLTDLPPELTSRYVSPQGQWLVQVFPKEQVWDLEPLERFVQDVRSVDPEATGTPLQNYEASRQIMESYENAGIYALVVIFFVMMLDFIDAKHRLIVLGPPLLVVLGLAALIWSGKIEGSPVFLALAWLAMTLVIAGLVDLVNFRDSLLAMATPLLGMAMTFGCLALFDVALNPANLIMLPLVLGIGVDNGVHMLHDFRAQAQRYSTSPSTINAIILTSLTNIVGFGSMMVSHHRGLYSLGLVLTVGVGACLFVSLVMLPPLLTLISRRNSGPLTLLPHPALHQTADPVSSGHPLSITATSGQR